MVGPSGDHKEAARVQNSRSMDTRISLFSENSYQVYQVKCRGTRREANSQPECTRPVNPGEILNDMKHSVGKRGKYWTRSWRAMAEYWNVAPTEPRVLTVSVILDLQPERRSPSLFL